MLFALLWMLLAPCDLPLISDMDPGTRSGVAVDVPTDSGLVHGLEGGSPQPPPK